jgi:hypothetical protein
VAYVNQQGTLADLPWDGVKQFCISRGLKWVPELHRIQRFDDSEYLTKDGNLHQLLDWIDSEYLEARFYDRWELAEV